MEANGFVCAINGGRDGYQVPAALHQAGLLRRFVTDYYAPDQPPGWLPGPMARRHSDLLPKASTVNSPTCFLLQHSAAKLGLPMNRVFPYTDPMLGRHALAQAKRLGANLYCYSGYLPAWRNIPRGMKVIDFEFHPLPGLTMELLRQDASRYPETAWSFAQEQRYAGQERVNDSWCHADAVVCASRMTARSLEHAGCEAERITVVPYGFEAGGIASRRPQQGPARFLFVGQGLQRKRLHHLLRAWRGVDPARAQLTLVCYAIDPGIAELAKQPGVELLGRQDRSALDQLMQRADVFIMPSLVEGFGLTYLEALAAGCHIVGTATPGCPICRSAMRRGPWCRSVISLRWVRRSNSSLPEEEREGSMQWRLPAKRETGPGPIFAPASPSMHGACSASRWVCGPSDDRDRIALPAPARLILS